MLFFLFGCFVGIFIWPLCSCLEVLIEQIIEYQKAKFALKICQINTEMENETQEPTHTQAFGFQIPETYQEEEVSD